MQHSRPNGTERCAVAFTMRYYVALIITIFGANLDTTFAATGVDVSSAVSKANWTCLKNKGYSFAIVRISRSTGCPDHNAATTIKNARAAGIQRVGGYIFPCKRCGNPKGQVGAALQNLRSNGAVIDQVWLSISDTKYWSIDKQENVKFIQDMVDEAKTQNVTAAMYTSKSQWETIMDINSHVFKGLKLWYTNFNNQANFKDFSSFGGWTKPTVKQYAENVAVCDVRVDENWHP